MIISKIKYQQKMKLEIVGIDKLKGRGVVATEDFPKGELVCKPYGRYLSFHQHHDHIRDKDDDFSRYMMELPIITHSLTKM